MLSFHFANTGLTLPCLKIATHSKKKKKIMKVLLFTGIIDLSAKQQSGLERNLVHTDYILVLCVLVITDQEKHLIFVS